MRITEQFNNLIQVDTYQMNYYSGDNYSYEVSALLLSLYLSQFKNDNIIDKKVSRKIHSI